MKQAHGFILITTLIFIQVFSYLSLYGLVFASASVKTQQHLWYKSIESIRVNTILQNLESKLKMETSRCLISITPATSLSKKSIEWWQSNACNGLYQGMRYFYVIESLGEDACAVIGKVSNVDLLIASYYRITLCTLPDKLKGAKYVWQATVALPVKQLLVCQGQLHEIRSGRQMLREL